MSHKQLILLLIACLCLAACSETVLNNYQLVPSRQHAISTNGTGYNVILDEANSKLTVSLDLKSAGSALLVKGFAPFGRTQGSSTEAEFEAIGKEWLKVNRPKCEVVKGRRVDTVHYELNIECKGSNAL